jgi:hypothetical protein
MKFKGKIESISLEKDAEYTRICFNNLEFGNPILDDLFLHLEVGEKLEIEIKRVQQLN